MSRPYSAALPIAHVVLRILIVLNWLIGAAILVLLVVMPNEQWIMTAFELSPSPEAERLVMGLRAIAVLGLVAIPLQLRRPQAAARDRRDGSRGRPVRRRECGPFAGDRLGAARAAAAQPRHRRDRQAPFRLRRIRSHLDAGFSINGWLAVLLTFLLARVFAEGALMREDLEGTV